MKTNLAAVFLGMALASAAAGARTVTDLSGDDWRADGEPATVPHTWNAEDGADGFGDASKASSISDGYDRRRVVYTRALPDAKPGKCYFIRCEGASRRAAVKVNGKDLGTHDDAFTAFVVDATAAMRGASNVLEIAVDNLLDDEHPPKGEDYTVYGGLYRGVSLIETDALHFDSVPDGGPGVALNADLRTGLVTVTPRVAGGTNPKYALSVVGPGLAKPVTADGLEVKVPSPIAWTPETPNVYRLTVTVREGAREDAVAVPFGFRTFDIRGKSLCLNAKPLALKGVGYHQDREGKGWLATEAEQEADLAQIRDLGANAIRTDYAHAQHVLDVCDRMGLVVCFGAADAAVRAQYAHHPSACFLPVAKLGGLFAGTMYDFGADALRTGPRPGVNTSGLVSYDRTTCRDAYYLYKANFSAKPLLHLVKDDRDVVTSDRITVTGYSTVGDVTLTVNGKVVGTKTPDARKTVSWAGVPLAEGDNAIRLTGGNLTAADVWRLAHPVTLYVATNGSDATGDGTAARPFATPAAARDALRKLKAAGRLCAGATVIVADGEYRLAEPLTLTAEDSGSARFPIVWKAAHRTKAVLSGAANLTWKKLASDDPMRELLPAASRASVLVAEISGIDPIPGFLYGGNSNGKYPADTPLLLYQGGEHLTCARWPDDGWAIIGKVVKENALDPNAPKPAITYENFEVKGERARLARWKKEPDFWMHGLWQWRWADTSERVLGVDPSRDLVTVGTCLAYWNIKEGNEFYALNAFCELDRPGEWAVDRRNRRVYVWPLKSVRAPVELARAESLVKGGDVAHVTLDGFVFELSQKDALAFTNACGVTVQASVIRRAGKWGVRVADSSRCRVDGCDVYDLDEGGVSLAGGDLRTLKPARNIAINNNIHHYGQRIPNYRPGIDLWGVGSRAERNLVHHSRHQAIQFHGNDQYVGYNICHDLCMHNEDAGGIYSYETDLFRRGSYIEYNVVHMTGDQPRANSANSIYLDAWTSGVTVRGNLLNRAPIGIWASGGQATRAERNVIMNCLTPVLRGNCGKGGGVKHVWGLGWKSGLMQRLIQKKSWFRTLPWRGRYRRMNAVFDLEDAGLAHASLWTEFLGNAFIGCGQMGCFNWDLTGAYTTVSGNRDFEDDPGFVDYYGLDWRLKPDSPLRKFLGGDTRFDRMGLFESPTRVSPVVKFSPDVTPPRSLAGEFPDAVARIDLTYDGKLPAGVTGAVTNMVNCNLPFWANGKRILTSFGKKESKASKTQWVDYEFSFEPTCDGPMTIWMMGAKGEATLYDDIRIEGVAFAGTGFENEKLWHKVHDGGSNPNFPAGVRPPCGVFETLPKDRAEPYRAAEGRRFASANHDFRVVSERLNVKKGVRVTIRFKARAYCP